MKRIFLILIFLLICTMGHATHNRAGQLLYRYVSGYTYEFTEVHFFYTLSPATDQRIRDGLDITWGDNTESKIPCVHVERLPDNYTYCLFRMQHTFPGHGVYTIIVSDNNRNEGVLNMANSVGTVFAVKTVFRIDPNIKPNNTPELLTYPIDKAAIGRRFVHNPSAFDSDGDSLSYEKVICLRERGIEIESYQFPEAKKYDGTEGELYVDPVTGDYVWDAPTRAGLFNIAMRINEWRNGDVIGRITRDMQIEVVNSTNQPPEIPPFRDTCVIAGTLLNISFEVTDPDNDKINVTATGGPFQVSGNNTASLSIDEQVPGRTKVSFTWQTDPSHVRKQPYTVVFKAEDQNEEVKLVSFSNYNITVIAPEVEILPAEAEKKEIKLEWIRSVCEHASGYEIYRSIGRNPVDLKICETGIPSGLGYERVTTVNGIDNVSYRDNNNGRGLSPGIEYCYRVVAIFSDGAKSKPSEETCASLLAGTPPMIRAHVETIDETSGEINVEWLEKPVIEMIEKLPDPPPLGDLQYKLFYSMDMNAGNWTLLATQVMGDTVFIHNGIDTKAQYPYYYKVELWNMVANTIVDEDFEIASSLYPILEPFDRATIITFGRYTPWINDRYEIYRQTDAGMYELVGVTDRETYKDEHLVNGREYCYRIRSEGYRNINGIEYRNLNWSHVACVTPFDNVPPCAPELEAKSICDESRNFLTWSFNEPLTYNNDNPSCWEDVEKYRVYFSSDPFSSDPSVRAYTKIDSVMNRDIFTWSHDGTLVGCYYVTAVDTAGNQSRASNIVCLDECGEYQLPNVFTPNGDNINDLFKSYNPGGVRKVDMKIFNRWGKMVFKTEDPNINWDGRDMDSKRFVSSGVYFYVCEVYEERLTGPRTIPLSGIIHVYSDDGAKPYNQ